MSANKFEKPVEEEVVDIQKLTKLGVEKILSEQFGREIVVFGQPGKWIFDGGWCEKGDPGSLKKAGHEWIK